MPRPNPQLDDADEGDGGEPFLRTRRRVPVRKGLLASMAPEWAQKWIETRWGMIGLGFLAVILLAGAVALVFVVRSFLDHDPRFRIDTSASVQTMGNSKLTRAELLSVFGSDIGRNLFFVPLAERRKELEQIPWVEHATVMRLLPNQLRVAVTERTPVAFARLGNKIDLVDAAGVVLEMSPGMMAARHYSFPVVTGINPGDPLSTRGARMRLYQKFIAEIDTASEKVSEQLSEVDLSDPEDVRATVPAKGSDLVLHFGDEDFLNRWHNYQSHIAEWQQQYPHLGSVDLRYEKEVVLKMTGGADVQPPAAAATQPAAKPAAPVAALVASPAKAHPVRHVVKHHPAKGKR
jgi:cell division protein FtsQ